MLVYLDVCCLNRPFDDQCQDRIRLETEAVLAIISECEAGKLTLLTSEVAFWEVEAILNFERREKVRSFLEISHKTIQVDVTVVTRGKEIEQLGFGGYDALHIASAEIGHADVFLTVDDGILSKAKRNSGQIEIKIMNPVSWLMERMWQEDANNDIEPN